MTESYLRDFNMSVKKNHFIITGAPSSGKSSVLNGLRKAGFSCYGEIAREVIRENLEQELEIFPWVNMQQFSDMVYDRMLQLYSSIENDLCFFDRSVVDLIGYMQFASQKAPEKYGELAKSMCFSKTVFIMPVWETIFENDQERKESLEDAKKIDQSLRDAYTSMGFELIDVPIGRVEERVGFILDKIGLEVQS